jgi:tRNA (cytidine/uridine-2'-O-)-methyltransferase
MLNLAAHGLKVALVHPQIAPNTGNVGRLCVATGVELHLVRPLGFVLSDRQLRRSAMDYWARVKLTVHNDLDAFETAMKGVGMWLFTTRGERDYWEAQYGPGDCLVFGSETSGLPERLLTGGRTVRIPQAAGERCLNLSTAAGIGVYEALRQMNGKALNHGGMETQRG